MKKHLWVLTLVLAGCTSALEKKCKETNWFAHGEAVALRGDRVTADDLVQSCQREGFHVNESDLDVGFKKGMNRYCTPEQTFITGKQGEFFRTEMCEGMNLPLLKNQHQKGVVEYCQKSNGQYAGGLGKKYNGVCPKNLEKDFLPEFKIGRKRYLNALAIEKEKEVQMVEREIIDVERKKMDLRHQINTMSTTRVVSRERRYDPYTRTEKEEVRTEEDLQLKNEKSRLEWDLRDLDREIENKRTKQKELRKEISDANTEAAGL